MRTALPPLPPLLVALCCSLAGCGTDGPLRFQAPSAGTGGPTSAATAGAPPLSGTAGAPPGAAAPGPSVKVGRSEVELAGAVFDPTCTRVVAPFELTSNFDDLMRVGAEVAAGNAGKTVEQWMDQAGRRVAGKPPARQAAAKAEPLSPRLRRAAKRMNWLPMSVEDQYGAYLMDRMKGRIMSREGKVGTKFYPRADALLAEVLAGVTHPHAYRFEVFVSTESGSNAMALPGGRIVIDKALLDDTPGLREKAYFAVAHEVGHVLQRHQTQALQARVIDAVALKGSLPDLVQTMRSAHSEPQAVVRLLMGGKLLFEKHSEQQELQADAYGMRMLDGGAADASLLIAAVTAFANGLPAPQPAPKEDALTAVIDLVQRPVDAHPTTVERKKNLEQMLVELGTRPGRKIDGKAGVPRQPRAQQLPTLPATR